MKDTKYDKPHLYAIQEISVVNLSETEYVIPAMVDGTTSVVESRDLQFWDGK
ncbi:hypothetical protein [Methanohalophilus sp.]